MAVKIRGKQIGTDLTDSNIDASAAIALSKLAEAVIQADGGQAFTGEQSMGSNKLTNVTDPTAAQDAATKAYVDAAVGGTPQQETVTTQTITGTDTAITDTLDAVPSSNASVQLYLNGVLQEQGAGLDYTISSQTITWLASTGTAVDMDTSDSLIAVYES